MTQALRLWWPSDGGKPRIVELLSIHLDYRQSRIVGAVIREVNKPLRGVAFVSMYELQKVKEDV